jgi:hypothetical protein
MKQVVPIHGGRLRRALALAALCLITASSSGSAGPSQGPRTRIPANPSSFGSVGVPAFTNIAELPFLREGVETRQFSAYDRAGDNYDHEYFPLYVEPNGECVIFDAMGPGCLYRNHMNLWYPWQGKEIHQGIRIRYYFDGERQPRIDMDVSTFFIAQNPLGIFREPLGIDGGSRFRLLYYPMVFRERLKVALSAEPGGAGSAQIPWEGRHDQIPERRSHWYQYTCHLFCEDPGLPSWTPESAAVLGPSLWEKPRLKQNPLSAISDPPERAALAVGPGQRARLWHQSGSGAITALRLTLTPLAENALFTTWLRITFDGQTEPQAEAPVGCFFGAYRTTPSSGYGALLLGYSPAEMYCYLPMPFWSSATIELENRGSEAVTVQAQLQTLSAAAPGYPRDRCGYFHARYHREAPRTEGQDYSYLNLTGAGHLVGHVVARWDTSMEENERAYFNGSGTPQVLGNGFEDDHNMGWGLQNLTHAVFGAHGAEGGAGCIYRFYLPDLYVFESALRQGHQTYGPRSPRGHEGLYAVGTEESVSFYYASETPRLRLTDDFDVGNLEAEARHGYTPTGRVTRRQGQYWYDGAANNVLTPTPATLDDGVAFDGSCTFTVAIAPDNHGIKIRRRTDKENNRQCAWVSIDGQRVTERPWYSVDFERTYRNIRWWDTDFDIPARYTQGKSQVTVKIEFVSAEHGDWDEFHYWIYSRRQPMLR